MPLIEIDEAQLDWIRRQYRSLDLATQGLDGNEPDAQVLYGFLAATIRMLQRAADAKEKK
jgi:hypothetical protein